MQAYSFPLEFGVWFGVAGDSVFFVGVSIVFSIKLQGLAGIV